MNSAHRWLSGRCCAENRANGPSATGPPSPTAFISTYYALGTAPCAQPGRLSQHLSEPTCPEDGEVASRRRLFGNFPQLSRRDAEGKKHQLCAVLPSDERPFLWSCPVSVSPLGCQQQFDEVTGALLGLTCFSSPSPACAPSAPALHEQTGNAGEKTRAAASKDGGSSGPGEGKRPGFSRIVAAQMPALNGQLLPNSNWFWVTSFETAAAFCSFFQLNLNNSHLTKLQNLVKNCSDLCK